MKELSVDKNLLDFILLFKSKQQLLLREKFFSGVMEEKGISNTAGISQIENPRKKLEDWFFNLDKRLLSKLGLKKSLRCFEKLHTLIIHKQEKIEKMCGTPYAKLPEKFEFKY